MSSISGLLSSLDSVHDEMVEALKELIRIPAIGPENGGEGEFERARYLKEVLERCGIDDIEMVDALDERVRLRLRPNIIARRRGRDQRTVWIVTHMDTVPPGDLDAWKYPPFSAKEEDGKIYGLGAEDNGQAIIASIYAVKALIESDITPEKTIGLAIVSDEETGNEKGINFLIEEGIFSKDDIIYVPDFGVPDGSVVEIAEKSILWLKFTVEGRQTHAATPSKGINALRIGSEFMVFMRDYLMEKYGKLDHLFIPPISTFEPTKRFQTVGNINTIPPQDVFYFDCRLLPEYDTDEVIGTVRKLTALFEDKTGASIDIEVVQETKAGKPSDKEGEPVKALVSAVKRIKNVEPVPRGIGGGTCANIFRQHGYEAYVWETVDRTAHSVDEYCRIENLVNDAKVFALTLAQLCYPDEFEEDL